MVKYKAFLSVLGVPISLALGGCDSSPTVKLDGNSTKSVTSNGVGASEASVGSVTKENYAKVKTGMTVAQVSAILGDPGTAQSETEAGGIKMAVYQWGSVIGPTVIGTFMNGKLNSKTQIGL